MAGHTPTSATALSSAPCARSAAAAVSCLESSLLRVRARVRVRVRVRVRPNPNANANPNPNPNQGCAATVAGSFAAHQLQCESAPRHGSRWGPQDLDVFVQSAAAYEEAIQCVKV